MRTKAKVATEAGSALRRASLALAGFGIALLLALGGPSGAENTGTAGSGASAATSTKFFKICKGQTYALCAAASCFVFNGLAYCKCDVKWGDSISLPFHFGRDEDVCTVNAEGPKNGYMVSTFSVPDSVVSPGGNQALYTWPAGTSDGA